MKKIKLFAILSAFYVTPMLFWDKHTSQAATGDSASGNSPAATSTASASDDRLRLYAAISSPYFLDGASFNPLRTHPFTAFYGGMKKVAGSNEPFVSHLVKAAINDNEAHIAMYTKLDAIRQGGDLDLPKLMDDKINNNLIAGLREFLGSDLTVRQILANGLSSETTAHAQDDIIGDYKQILADAKMHPRGAPVDPQLFAADFIDRKASGHVHATLRNGTGHTLHNVLVIADDKRDPSKIQVDDNAFLVLFGGPEFQKAHDAFHAASMHLATTDHGFEVFVPEWKDGQTLEVPFCESYEVGQDQLLPGEISVFSDESTAVAIPLQPEKMAAAFKHPAAPNPAELTSQEQYKKDVVDQANSLRVYPGDGAITYRYLIYPFWSQGPTKVTAPPNTKYVSIVWEPGVEIGMAVSGYVIDHETLAKAMVDGHIIKDGAKINCGAGSVLELATTSTNDPVAVAIRFLQREPTSAEKDHLDLKPTAEEEKTAIAPDILPLPTRNGSGTVADHGSVPPAHVINPAGPWKNGDIVSATVAPKIAGVAIEISAEIDPVGPSGAIVTQGGATQGYAVYLKDGKLAFSVRENRKLTTIIANDLLGAGHFTVLATIQKDGTLALLVNGKHVADGKAAGPIPDQPKAALCVGFANRVAMGDYKPPYIFSGKITNVTVKAAVEK